MERFEDAKALRHLQRHMVWQHDAAGPDANPLRHVRDVPDHHFRRRACDQRRVVMLGEPVARVAEFVGEPREVERIAQRVDARRAGRYG
jgi:hypothetical protein